MTVSKALDVIACEQAGTLYGLFRERVARSPAAIAYVQYDRPSGEWRQYSWRDVAERVVQWQATLSEEGLERGDRVAILMRSGVDWVVCDQAALGLGLVVVPLYADDRPDSIAYILRDAGVRLLYVQDEAAWRKLAPALGAEYGALRRVVVAGSLDKDLGQDAGVCSEAAWLRPATGELREPVGEAGDLASIVYTSGTTGRPKGVMLSHRNMMAVAQAGLSVIDVYPDDCFLSFLPLSHTLERTVGYYLPIMAGATVAYSRSILELPDDLQQVRPTLLIAVPRIFERVYGRILQQMKSRPPVARRLFELAVAVGWRRFEVGQGRASWSPGVLLWPLLRRLVAAKIGERLGGRLRLAVSGGAALPVPVARLFIGLGINILQGYGLTETSPVISVNTLERNDPSTVGPPLPGIELRVGADDELLVKSPGVMLGYWNKPEATAAIIDAEGWLHTGDQVRIEPGGAIRITGRIKDILVLSNGEKVPPGELEANICLDPLFEQVLVVGEGRPYLLALCVPGAEEWRALAQESGLDPDSAAGYADSALQRKLVARINAALKDFPAFAKVRRAILTAEPWTVENGLLTPTLKLKRQAVLERFAGEIEGVYEQGPARALGAA